MSGTRRIWILVTLATAVLVLSAFVAAFPKEASKVRDETKLDKKDLPVAVIAAFQKAYPKATIEGASKEVKDSVQYYEVESKDGKTERSILYQQDGSVFEIEEQVQTASLPEPVKAAVGKDFPKGKIDKAEKITRGATVEYEITVATGKEKAEVLLDNTGKVIKSEKASATDEKDEEEED